MSDTVDLVGSYRVTKANDEDQLVFGWANVSVHADGDIEVDAHGDSIAPDTLAKAAYQFVVDARASGEDHAGDADAVLVESMMFTAEKCDALGIEKGVVPEAGWWVGFHIPDAEAYERAKTEKTEFSIQGTARRVEVPA